MDRWLTIAGVGETGPEALSEPVKTALGNASLIVAAPRFHAALATMLGKAGHVIGFPSPLADLYPKLETHKGQKIIIQSIAGPVTIENSGVARVNAQIGELIKAKNEQSGKIVEGIVVSRKKIRVLTK